METIKDIFVNYFLRVDATVWISFFAGIMVFSLLELGDLFIKHKECFQGGRYWLENIPSYLASVIIVIPIIASQGTWFNKNEIVAVICGLCCKTVLKKIMSIGPAVIDKLTEMLTKK